MWLSSISFSVITLGWESCQDFPAFDADVSRDSGEGIPGQEKFRIALQVLNAHALRMAAGGSGKGSCRLPDLEGGKPSYFGDFFRWVFLDALFEFLKPYTIGQQSPCRKGLSVMITFSMARASAQSVPVVAEVDIRQGGRLGTPGINHNEFPACLLDFADGVPDLGPGLFRGPAPQDGAAGFVLGEM